MRRSTQALEQLAQQQSKAVACCTVLVVLLGGAHHKPTHHRNGAIPTFHEHVSTFSVIGNVKVLSGWFHPVRKDFGFVPPGW
jgi:hypothetical protein